MKTFANVAGEGANLLEREGFEDINRVKPAASKPESAEIFIVATKEKRQ